MGVEEIELTTSACQVSRSSDEEFAGDLRKMLDRTQANIDEIKIFHTSSKLMFMMKFLSDELDIIFFKSEAYEMVSCTNSSAG